MDNADPKTQLAERRTSLARLRVNLALERTTLAWIRTTLAMTSFGLGIIGFFRSLKSQQLTEEAARMHQNAVWFGYGLLGVGSVATVLCAIVHLRSIRALDRGELPASGKWSLGLALAFLLGFAGLVTLYRLAWAN